MFFIIFLFGNMTVKGSETAVHIQRDAFDCEFIYRLLFLALVSRFLLQIWIVKLAVKLFQIKGKYASFVFNTKLHVLYPLFLSGMFCAVK